MRKHLLTLMLAASVYLSGFSQSSYLDSLHQAYQTETNQTRFKTLYRYCFGLMQVDADKALEFMNEGKKELEKSLLPDSKKAHTLGLFSEVEAMMAQNEGNYEKSLLAFQKCLEYAEQSEGKDKYLLQGLAYWGRGVHYGQQGIYGKSTVEFLKAEPVFIKADQPGKQGDVYAQIAQNHHQLQQYDSTIIYINKALALIDPVLDVTNQYYYIFFKANAFNAMGKPDSTIALLGDT